MSIGQFVLVVVASSPLIYAFLRLLHWRRRTASLAVELLVLSATGCFTYYLLFEDPRPSGDRREANPSQAVSTTNETGVSEMQLVRTP